MNPVAFDFQEARDAINAAKQAQYSAEQDRRDAAEKLAAAERSYRVELAKAIVEQHAEGVAWSVASDVARGQKNVADLRYTRDVAKGVLDACETAAWRHSANRRDLERLTEWSMRVAPLGEQREAVPA